MRLARFGILPNCRRWRLGLLTVMLFTRRLFDDTRYSRACIWGRKSMLLSESFSQRNSLTLVAQVPGVKEVASLLLMFRNQTV